MSGYQTIHAFIDPSSKQNPISLPSTLSLFSLSLSSIQMQMESLLSLPSSSTFRLLHYPTPLQFKDPSNLTPKPFSPKTLRLPKPTSTFSLSSSTIPSPSISTTDSETEPLTSAEKFDWFSKWYPLSPICDLDERAPHAKRVLGLDVVVWWDRQQGRWQVFDDRCPHRLAPLSEGRIDRQGRLQCVYHGWCFDGEGSCKYIPQAPPEGPPVHTFNKACAAVYPSFVQNKILWFWPNTSPEYEDIAEREEPPCVPELDDPSYSCTMGTRDLHYGYDVLIENLMDPAHVPYAHHGIMRIPKRPGPPPPDREGGRPMDINIETLDLNGFLSKLQYGHSKFVAPCLYHSFPSLGPTSRNGSIPSANSKENSPSKVHQKQRRMLLVVYCIPVSPGESRVIWVFPRNFAIWVDNIIPRWIFHVRNNLILDSDLYLLHVEERKIAEVGASNWQKACFVPTKSDANVIAFRKWFRKYSNDKVDWGSKFNGLLPPTPPRDQLMDRYWTHVVNCSSCRSAVKGLKVLEFCLQVISLVSIGILAAAKEKLVSAATRTAIVSVALLFFLASRWLAHFIYRNFYYHDYNHALV